MGKNGDWRKPGCASLCNRNIRRCESMCYECCRIDWIGVQVFLKVLRIFCMPCVDNTGYSAYMCFHAGRCSDMQYNVPGIWWNVKGCVSAEVWRFWQHGTHVWMIVEYSEMCWCVMRGHMIKRSEMVGMCAGHFGVRRCRDAEGIRMVLKISEMCKCPNMRKCGFTCVERVHTHHHIALHHSVFVPSIELCSTLTMRKEQIVAPDHDIEREAILHRLVRQFKPFKEMISRLTMRNG